MLFCAALSALLGRLGQGDAQLVRQPRRRGHPQGAGEVVQHRRLRHRHPAAAVRSDRPAHPARAPPRGQGLLHRPDEPRPRLRRGVRQRQLAGAAARRGRDKATDDDVLKGAAETVTWDDGVYAFPQWANTQVLWYRKSLAAGGRARHDPARHLGPDHRRRRRQRRHGRRPGQQVRGLRRADQRADPGRRRRHHLGQRGRQGREDRHRLRRRREAAAAVIQKLASSKAAQPDLTTSNEGTSLGQMFGGRRRVHDQLDLRLPELQEPGRQRRHHPGASSTTWGGPATRRRSRARSPGRRSAASTSASAPTPSTRTSRSRQPPASPPPTPRSTWPSTRG